MIYNKLYLLIFVLVLFSHQTNSCNSKEGAMLKPQNQNDASQSANNYIKSFKSGEDFVSPSQGLISNGKPDSMAVWILGHELAEANPNVRENIVNLLVDVGVSSDTLFSQGAEVLRNIQIVEVLVNSGLIKNDLGRDASMDALRNLVPLNILNRFADVFGKTLENSPSSEAFLLVAKAKPLNAKKIVDELARLDEWKDDESVRIAQAALGAVDIEDEYLENADSAEATMDGNEFSPTLLPLSLIGSKRCLFAIANRLRTPLIFEIPDAYQKSVRLDVLEALLYNYPEQPVLYPNNIISEEDYTAAENFCKQTFGVKYNSPPPPFMTYFAFPSH